MLIAKPLSYCLDLHLRLISTMSSLISDTLDNILPTMESMDQNSLISVYRSLEGLMTKAKQLLNLTSPTGNFSLPRSVAPPTELPNISDCNYTCNFLDHGQYDRIAVELKSLDYHHSLKANSPSTFQYSDTYTYVYNKDTQNAKAHPITPVMRELLDHANNTLKTDFNHVLINKYHNLKSFLGPHQDDEKQLDPSSPVATISLGSTRRLRVSAPPVHNRNKTVDDVVLESNSCFLMLPGFQGKYFHSLLAGRSTKPEEKGRRYSITLRRIIADPEPTLPPASASSPDSPKLSPDPTPSKDPVAASTTPVPDTLVFGSSLTKGLNSKVLSKYDKTFKVYTNRGAVIKAIQNDVKKVADSGDLDCTAIKSLFFVCGGNNIQDAKKNSDVSCIQEDYNNLIQYARNVFPNARINVVSLIPRRTRYFCHKENMLLMNKWLEKFCNDQHVRFVNIFSFYLDKMSLDINYDLFQPDNIHFTEIGYSILAKVLIAVANRPRKS